MACLRLPREVVAAEALFELGSQLSLQMTMPCQLLLSNSCIELVPCR